MSIFNSVMQGVLKSVRYVPEDVIVLGKSNIGFKIAEEGLRRGSRIKITSRTDHSKNKEYKNIEFIHTPKEDVKNSDFWKNMALKHIQQSKHVMIVNTIGGSSAEPPHSIEDVNIHIPLAAIKGITEAFKQNNQVEHYNIIQLSTLPAGTVAAPYPETKRECDLQLMKLPLTHLTILKMGHVVEPFFKFLTTHLLKEQNRLVAEQMALLPIFPLIGDEKGRNQVKMQTVDVRDVVEASFNASELSLKTSGVLEINAVSQEVLTQEQFFKFHSALVGRKFRPLYIPIDAANLLVKHHPYGRFKSYVTKYCAQNGMVVDSTPFKELLCREPMTLYNSYTDGYAFDDIRLSIPFPPIIDYSRKFMKTLWNKPEARMETCKAVFIIMRSLWSNRYNFKGDVTGSQSEDQLRAFEQRIQVETTKEKTYQMQAESTRISNSKYLKNYSSLEEFTNACLENYDEYINNPIVKKLNGNDPVILKEAYRQYCQSRYSSYRLHRDGGNPARMI